MMLLFRPKPNNNTDERLAEKIRKDLSSTFNKKGINISNIQIEMKSGSMNIEVFMDEKK